MHIPTCANPRLESEGELRKVDEALLAGVGCVVGQRLAHQVDLVQKSGLLQASLHQFDGLEGDEGVEVAVDTDWGTKYNILLLSIAQDEFKCRIYKKCFFRVFSRAFSCNFSDFRQLQNLTNVASGFGHTNGTFGSGYTVDVTLGSDAHGGGDGLAGLLADLNGPFHLFNVLELLK